MMLHGGETDDTDVMGEIFASELSAEAYFVGFVEQSLFEFHVAESAAVFVACSGEVVVVFYRCLLYGGKIHFGRCAADDERDMVGGHAAVPSDFIFSTRNGTSFWGLSSAFVSW